MLMRNTSAPASNSCRIIALSDDAGPRVARILMRRRRLMAWAPPAGGGRPGAAGGLDGPEPRRDRPVPSFPESPAALRRLLVGFGQLHGPCSLFAGVDLEEAGAVEPSRQAILGPLDGEFLVARAHEGLSRPFAATIVIERVDVIVARDQRAAQQRLATPRRHVPPAFGGPALGVLVAERDADPAGSIVAEPEIGRGRAVPQARPPPAQASASGRRSCVCRRGDRRRVSFAVMQRSYINH